MPHREDVLVRIRNFEPSDLENWIQLVALYTEGIGLPAEEGERLARLSLMRPGGDPKRDVFVAEEGSGRMVGFSGFFLEASIDRATLFVYVAKYRRRRGIGTRLVKFLLKKAQAAGAALTHARLSEDDNGARAFLSQIGFSRVRRHLEMERDLGGRDIGGRRGTTLVLDRFQTGQEIQLARLQNRVFSGSWGFAPNGAADIRYFLETTNTSMDDVLRFRHNGGTVGYLWPGYPREPEGASEAHTGRFHMLGLLPRYRGRGWGRDILEEGFMELRRHNLRRVRLTVDSGNVSAIHLYRALGFRVRGAWAWYGMETPGSETASSPSR